MQNNNGELYAVRTWKRDGSKNKMKLEDAVANLVFNAGEKKQSKDKLRKALLEGEQVSTELATFQLDWQSYESMQQHHVGVGV